MVRRDISIHPSEIVTLCPKDKDETNNRDDQKLTQDSDSSRGSSSIVYFADEDDSTHEMRGYLSSDSTAKINNSRSDEDTMKKDSDHDVLPSAEDARTYAANILKNSRFGSGQEAEESIRNSFRIENIDKKKSENDSKCGELFANICVSLIKLALAVLLLLSCITGIWGLFDAYNIRRNNRNHIEVNNSVDSPRFQDTVNFLSINVSNGEKLISHGTPQNLAAKWIADVDLLQRDVPSSFQDDDDFYSDSSRFVQRYILALLYFSMSGDGWHEKIKFLTGEDECGWYTEIIDNEDDENDNFVHGVVCRGADLTVRELYLPENNLRGSIPSELMHLSQLDLISLRRNSVSGTIPEEFKRLERLRYLDLAFNSIDGTLPQWLGSLSHLEVIGLSSNNLHGSIPSSFISLTDLTTLTLEKNMLRGDLSYLSEAKKLNYIYIGNNLFDGTIDDNFLVGMDSLIEFDASNNLFNSTGIPSHLISHPTLTLLDLSNNLLRGQLQEFNSRSNLNYLSLRKNFFSGTLPKDIAFFTKLSHLDIEINSFTGTIPKSLAGLENLTHLFLGHNAFYPAAIPGFLSGLTNLEELSLAASQRIGEIPEWFNGMDHLRYLDLQKNSLNGTLPQYLWEDMPQLSSLFLNENFLGGILPENYRYADNLEIVALHKNTIGGSANPLCDQAHHLKLYTLDCDLVRCKHHCCPRCCWKQDSQGCFDEMLMQLSMKEDDTTMSSSDLSHHNHLSSSSFGPPLEIAQNLRGSLHIPL